MDGGAYPGSFGKRPYPGHDDEAPDHNGRQRKRKDVDSDRLSAESEYRILCPAEKVGSLIGRGGSNIKALRQECKSKIKVEDPIPGSDERVIYICSVSKNNSHNQDSKMQSLCPAQEALFQVHSWISEVGASDDDEAEPPCPVIARLLVPSVQIGCVIGKGGKIIEQMRREIGAQIRVLPKEQIPPWVSNTDEMIQLSGDPALVKKALKAVSSRLHENPPRDKVSGGVSEGFYAVHGPTTMVAGADFYPSGNCVPQTGHFLGPVHVGGSMMSVGAFYGAAGYSTAWSAAMQPSYRAASGHAAEAEDGVEEELFLRVLCPNDRVGSMIGKGGSVIRKMREDTATHIKVGDPIPYSDERVIEITSTEYSDSLSSPGVEAALQVHNRLVELQPENDVYVTRLLVPASQIGCILGKGGSIITEIRKASRANIRIPPKDELPQCASENDELVQITGDENVVLDALSQVLNRLRSNLFRGRNSDQSGNNFSIHGLPYAAAPMLPGYGDKGLYGGLYPFAQMGYQNMDYGNFGQEQASGARRSKELRQR